MPAQKHRSLKKRSLSSFLPAVFLLGVSLPLVAESDRPERQAPTADSLRQTIVTTNPDGTLNRGEAAVGGGSAVSERPASPSSSGLERARVTSSSSLPTVSVEEVKKIRWEIPVAIGLFVLICFTFFQLGRRSARPR